MTENYTQWRIEVKAEANTRDAAIAAFEREVLVLKWEDYEIPFTASAECLGDRVSVSRIVAEPRPAPLTAQEIERLRRVLSDNDRAKLKRRLDAALKE